jgi:DNA-directed RNA polymerase specialized sigma24 family protein
MERTVTREADQAFAVAVELTQELRDLGRRIEALGMRRRRLMLIANRGGVTYDDLSAGLGIDRSRVGAEIQRAKAENPTS